MSDVEANETAHHTEEDENYFISMTDMMVGILFVFIILLMVFALNLRQQTDTSEEEISRLREVAEQALATEATVQDLQRKVEQEIDIAASASKVKGQLLKSLQDRLHDKGLSVVVDVESGVLRLDEDAIGFELDRSDLRGSALQNVQRLAEVLDEVLPTFLPLGQKRESYLETVFIEGHTDSQGTAERNWTLSTERAVNTFWALIEHRPRLQAMNNRQLQPVISAAGYADSRPIPYAAVTDYELQRRIDLRFVMDTDNVGRLETLRGLSDQISDELGNLQDAVRLVDAQ